jgi:hypothetical protein
MIKYKFLRNYFIYQPKSDTSAKRWFSIFWAVDDTGSIMTNTFENTSKKELWKEIKRSFEKDPTKPLGKSNIKFVVPSILIPKEYQNLVFFEKGIDFVKFIEYRNILIKMFGK